MKTLACRTPRESTALYNDRPLLSFYDHKYSPQVNLENVKGSLYKEGLLHFKNNF